MDRMAKDVKNVIHNAAAVVGRLPSPGTNTNAFFFMRFCLYVLKYMQRESENESKCESERAGERERERKSGREREREGERARNRARAREKWG